MKQIGEISTIAPLEILRIARRVLSNGHFVAGLLMMAVSFFSFMGALAIADMSLVVPATSISFVLATLGARFYLHERIDRLRWLGTAMVLLGVMLVSLP